MSNLRVGKNILTNRLGILNNEINYNWLNLTLTGSNAKNFILKTETCLTDKLES